MKRIWHRILPVFTFKWNIDGKMALSWSPCWWWVGCQSSNCGSQNLQIRNIKLSSWNAYVRSLRCKQDQSFYCPGLKADVSNYCRSCHTCQMVGKPNQVIPKAGLQPIPAFDEPLAGSNWLRWSVAKNQVWKWIPLDYYVCFNTFPWSNTFKEY